MSNKKTIITSVLVAVLVVATLTATYAYFQARIGTGSTTNTTVTAKTIDGLTFNQGTNLSISATQTNFASGKGNLSSSTSPTVTLKARNDAAASYNYKACLNITENTFVHSQISLTETSSGRTVNLLPYPYYQKSTTQAGVNWTLNDDRSITVYGTPTDYSALTIIRTSDSNIIEQLKNQNLILNLNPTKNSSSLNIASDIALYKNSSVVKTFGFSSFPANVSTIGYDFDTITISIKRSNNNVLIDTTLYPQLEVGSSASPYDQYGYIENTDLELTVTKNGTTVLTKDITHGTGEICIPTTNGGSTTTHTISAAAGSTTTDTWNATVTFKNYNNNQNVNLDKTFNSNFVFTRI